MTVLSIGDIAPDIALPRDGGNAVSLSDFTGQKVVLYFYPKDDTPGCTKEAIGFTQMAPDFARAGTVVLGVSKDPVNMHDKFVAKHDLGIALLSDADGDVCERYGTWGEKSMYGKTFMGIERATFLIDETGKISQIWRKVKVDGHTAAVLAACKAQ